MFSILAHSLTHSLSLSLSYHLGALPSANHEVWTLNVATLDKVCICTLQCLAFIGLCLHSLPPHVLTLLSMGLEASVLQRRLCPPTQCQAREQLQTAKQVHDMCVNSAKNIQALFPPENSTYPAPNSYNTAPALDYVMRNFSSFTMSPYRNSKQTGIYPLSTATE